MLARPGAQIAPNLTGLSERRCATCQSAVYSSGPRRQLFGDDARLVGLLHLPQDLAGPQPVALHPAARGVAVAVDAAQPLDRIEEPGLAADREVEAAVAVGDDVEPGRLLRVDHRGDRVDVLLAEQRVAHHRLERATLQAGVVPQGARIRPGDRGRHHHVAGGGQHSSAPRLESPSQHAPSRHHRQLFLRHSLPSNASKN